MAEGRQRVAWQHTSMLAAPLWNAIRDPKKKPFTPADFDPFTEKGKKPALGVEELRQAFEARFPKPCNPP